METLCSVRPEAARTSAIPRYCFLLLGHYQSLGSRQLWPLSQHSQESRAENLGILPSQAKPGPVRTGPPQVAVQGWASLGWVDTGEGHCSLVQFLLVCRIFLSAAS